MGIQIPKSRFPARYNNLSNVWKLNLPCAWRLLYSLHADTGRHIIFVLDILTHKEYERLFGY